MMSDCPTYDPELHKDKKPECFGIKYSYLEEADCDSWCKYWMECKTVFESGD